MRIRNSKIFAGLAKTQYITAAIKNVKVKVARKLLGKHIFSRLHTMKEAKKRMKYPLPFVLTGSLLKSRREDDDGWMISAENESGEVCLYTWLPTAL